MRAPLLPPLLSAALYVPHECHARRMKVPARLDPSSRFSASFSINCTMDARTLFRSTASFAWASCNEYRETEATAAAGAAKRYKRQTTQTTYTDNIHKFISQGAKYKYCNGTRLQDCWMMDDQDTSGADTRASCLASSMHSPSQLSLTIADNLATFMVLRLCWTRLNCRSARESLLPVRFFPY